MRQHALRRIALALTTLAICSSAFGQTDSPRGSRGCPPVSERKAELGCYAIATDVLGQLPPTPLYWHMDSYATRAAAEAAKSLRGTVVESLGKVWLFTIAASDFRPVGGERIAKIGPLPVDSGRTFTAKYFEAVMLPGADAPVHRHPGPEVWYQASGEVCLETPEGMKIGRVGGEPVIVPGSTPMKFTVTGTEKRRSIFLVLYDSSQPWTALASDWTPKGMCKK